MAASRQQWKSGVFVNRGTCQVKTPPVNNKGQSLGEITVLWDSVDLHTKDSGVNVRATLRALPWKASWGSRSIAPLIPNLSRRSEWLALLSIRFTPGNNSDTHCCVITYLQMAALLNVCCCCRKELTTASAPGWLVNDTYREGCGLKQSWSNWGECLWWLKAKHAVHDTHDEDKIASVDKRNRLDVTFCILCFSSYSCSTCFGQPCAHHQELTTAWCYSLVLVCALAAGRLSSPVGR